MSKKVKKKEPFNIYEFTYRHKKKIVGTVSFIIVLSMIFSIFAQFAYAL